MEINSSEPIAHKRISLAETKSGSTFVSLSKSALSPIEFETLEERLSYMELFRLTKDIASKIDV